MGNRDKQIFLDLDIKQSLAYMSLARNMIEEGCALISAAQMRGHSLLVRYGMRSAANSNA